MMRRLSVPLLKNTLVLTTHEEGAHPHLREALERLGAKVYHSTSLSTRQRRLTAREKETLRNLQSFDWIVFTSANGVRFLLEHLRSLSVPLRVLRRMKLCAVGSGTAETLRRSALPVHFTPSRYLTERVGEELHVAKGTRILLPRTEIATRALPRLLERRGASVAVVSTYTTRRVRRRDRELELLLRKGRIDYVLFLSPSAVEGFVGKLKDQTTRRALRDIPAIAIGPVTARAAARRGFREISAARTHTIEGVIEALLSIERQITES